MSLTKRSRSSFSLAVTAPKRRKHLPRSADAVSSFLSATFSLSSAFYNELSLCLFTRILVFIFAHAVPFVFYGGLLQLRLLIPNRSIIVLSFKLMPNLIIHVFKILLSLLELLSSLISYAALALLHCLEG